MGFYERPGLRITCRQDIFNKWVESLELFRVQNVTSLHPW
jgi:hypothetical protein